MRLLRCRRAWAHPDGRQALMSAALAGGHSLLVWQLPLAVGRGEAPRGGRGEVGGRRAGQWQQQSPGSTFGRSTLCIQSSAFPGTQLDLLGSTRTRSSLKTKLALIELLRLAAPARRPAPSADAPAPVELSFQERYGELTGHLWLEGGHVLAGFKSGQVRV